MLAAIINEKDNNYYLNIEDDNDTKKVYVIHTYKDKTRCLSKEEAINLFNTIMSSKLTYKEKNGEYDVYLDEANNERYFKDGKEDINLLFEKNGKSAILYEENDKDKKKKKEPLTPEEKAARIRFIVGFLIFNIIADPPLFHLGVKYIPSYYEVADMVSTKEITLEDAEELIESSEYLSAENKELLNNKNLLEDVLETANNERNYTLNKKLNNIKIKTFPQEKYPHYWGFYKPFKNLIYLSEDINKYENSPVYNDVLSHEYVHLLQSDNNYNYICEACAEIISAEYFDTREEAYLEEIKRVKTLMEIIGPKPVLECNFSADTTGFEDAIGEYLTETEKKELLELFENGCDDFRENGEDINKKVDELLAKMYYNKYGSDINDDEIIHDIYHDQNFFKHRVYFNENSKNFDKEYVLGKKSENLGTMELAQDAFSSDQFEECIWYKEIETQDEFEYKKIMEENSNNPYEVIVYYNYKQKDGVSYSELGQYPGFEYEGNFYFEPEAIEKGLVTKTYYLSVPVIVKSIDEIDKQGMGFVEFKFKDGSIGKSGYYNGRWADVDIYKETPITLPSIKEKFSDQFEKEESKEIEILDMFEEEAKNEKSEVKLI